jgi:hypothetical protein
MFTSNSISVATAGGAGFAEIAVIEPDKFG